VVFFSHPFFLLLQYLANVLVVGSPSQIFGADPFQAIVDDGKGDHRDTFFAEVVDLGVEGGELHKPNTQQKRI